MDNSDCKATCPTPAPATIQPPTFGARCAEAWLCILLPLAVIALVGVVGYAFFDSGRMYERRLQSSKAAAEWDKGWTSGWSSGFKAGRQNH